MKSWSTFHSDPGPSKVATLKRHHLVFLGGWPYTNQDPTLPTLLKTRAAGADERRAGFEHKFSKASERVWCCLNMRTLRKPKRNSRHQAVTQPGSYTTKQNTRYKTKNIQHNRQDIPMQHISTYYRAYCPFFLAVLAFKSSKGAGNSDLQWAARHGERAYLTKHGVIRLQLGIFCKRPSNSAM